MLKRWVALERSFEEVEGDRSVLDWDFRESSLRYSSTNLFSWTDLFEQPRVVLLGQPGSGKSEECRRAVAQLREAGRSAFYIRLEDLEKDDIAIALSGADTVLFDAWRAGSGIANFLLDSVDEARLRGGSLERALRRFAHGVTGAQSRVRVIVTSRPQDWRGDADLAVFKEELPALPALKVNEAAFDAPYVPDASAMAALTSVAVATKPLIVHLLGLTREQVERFAQEHDVLDADLFTQAVTEAEAWNVASRPLDLIQLIALWQDERRLGSPGELLERQIARLVTEVDPDRASKSPYTSLDIRKGLQRIAAAMELGRCSAVAVPGKDVVGSETLLDLRQLFPDREEQFLGAVLGARVFDPESLGKVRFHHSKTREFLAASWFRDILQLGISRTAVECIFFRPTLAARRVVPPSLRPTLGWVASFHEGIAIAAIKHCPDALLVEGDPALLATELRSKALAGWVNAAEAGHLPLERLDFAQLRRFAAPELAGVINASVVDPNTPERARYTLLTIVAEGQLNGCVDAAARVAIKSNFAWDVRVIALEAVASAGTGIQRRAVVKEALLQPELPDRFAATLIEHFLGRELTSDRLESVLCAAQKNSGRFEIEHHALALATWIAETPDVAEVRAVASRVVEMLFRPPLNDDHRGTALSAEFAWLSPVAKSIALRLAQESAPQDELFFHAVLAARTAEERKDVFDQDLQIRMASLFGQSGFRRGLFECLVQALAYGEDSPVVVAYRARTMLGTYSPEDRTWLWELIAQPTSPLAAKTALAAILRFLEEAPALNGELRSLVANDHSLLAIYDDLTPRASSREQRKYQNWEAKRAAQLRRAKAKNVSTLRNSTAVLRRDAAQIRAGEGPGALIWARNWIAHHPPSESKNSSHHGELSPDDLFAVFGADVGGALEEGYRAYWRREHPPIPSDYAPNSTPYSAVIGLIGLHLESERDPDFVATLSAAEASRAGRYALWEMNGFPAWFAHLVRQHPALIEAELSAQVDQEFAYQPKGQWIPWTLYRLSYADDALGRAFAPLILGKLERVIGASAEAVKAALKIVLTHVDDKERLQCMVERALRYVRLEQKRLVWLAALVRLDAEQASRVLRRQLDRAEPDRRQEIVVSLTAEVTGLHGLSGKGLPQSHTTPAGARALLAIVAEYVRVEDDKERAGAIGSRHEAQDFRDLLINAVVEAPGEESVRLLVDLASREAVENQRTYLSGLAERRSRADAEDRIWPPGEVFGFELAAQRAARTAIELSERCLGLLDDIADEIQFSELFPTTSWQCAEEETSISDLLLTELRHRNKRNWSITREEEVKNLKRTDLRVREGGVGPVAVEVKIADRWTLHQLKAALTDQLIGRYMLGEGNVAGLLVVVTQGSGTASLASRRKLEVTYDQLAQELEALTRSEAGRLGSGKRIAFRMLLAHGNVGQRLRKPRGSGPA